jgi:hypothetical protein
MKQRLFNLLWIAALAISLAACGTSTTSAASTTPAAVAVNPTAVPAATATPAPIIPTTTIIKAYEADQAAADAQYQGQTLIMTGKVTNINDVFGTQALLLRDSESDTGLQCYLTDSADAAKAAIGQTITIEGTIKGGELGFFMVAEPCKVIS